MIYSIKRPELLEIYDPAQNRTAFGGDQAWFRREWPRRSGCGPTSAANMTAYLAHSRAGMEKLYYPEGMSKQDYLMHMETLFAFVTPGIMGVNHVSKFEKGMQKYAQKRDVEIDIRTLSVEDFREGNRDVAIVERFVREGLERDCPMAFLNLSRGHEHRLQDWHWITITSASFEGDQMMVTASDEGIRRTFDLKLWFSTTKMHGGLVYIA